MSVPMPPTIDTDNLDPDHIKTVCFYKILIIIIELTYMMSFSSKISSFRIIV